MAEKSRLLSIPEVARQIGVTRQRVHILIANRQLGAVRLGHYYYVQRAELERYLALPQGKPFSPRSTGHEHSVDEGK